MGQPVQIKSPLKGVVKNPSFQDHPADAALDALNVRPFDHTGRLRVNQRGGTDKVYAAALVASSPIQGMLQATLALDPSTVATSVLFDDPFIYANGALNTVSGGKWTAGQTLVGTNFSPTATPTVTSSVLDTNSTVNWQSSKKAVDQANLGTSYVVQISFNPFSGDNGTGFGVAIQMQAGNEATTGYMCWLSFSGTGNATAVINKANGAGSSIVASSGSFAVSSAVHTLEAHLSPTALAVWVDGVTKLTYAFPGGVNPYVSNLGSGFAFLAGSSTHIKVSDFQMLGGLPPAALRQTNVIAVCGGNIYEGINLNQPVLCTGGSAAVNATAIPSMCYDGGNAFVVDGYVTKKVALATSTVTTLTATAGSIPTNCTLSAVWRGRLILAAPRTAPQNFFMSRVNVPTDFDFSQRDSAAAFAGNASTAGHIGEPITALIPFSDDLLFIGGDHNMWVVRGDPADGGSIDIVSDAIGVLGPSAWCKAPDGTIYFAGTGGLYKIAPGTSLPVNISNAAWNEYFRALNRANLYIMLNYDRDQQGFFVFASAVNTGASTHLWYDLRTGGFWPLRFPDTQGPVATLVYDGDDPTSRVLLLGGRDGFVRRQSLTDMDDDGTAISSFVFIGPYKTSETSENQLEWMDIILGEPPPGFTSANWNCQINVYGASTVEQAYTQAGNTSTRQKIFTSPRRQIRWLARQRGSVFLFKISNAVDNATWSLENITALVTPAGTVRRR